MLCALPRAGTLGHVAAMVSRFGDGKAEIIVENSAHACRTLLGGGGCDVAVIGDDPLGQYLLGEPAYRETPLIVVARSPSRASQRGMLRDEMLDRGAFVCVFAADASFAVVETALEAARSHLALVGPAKAVARAPTRGALLRDLDRLLFQPERPPFSLLVGEIRSFDLLGETLGRASVSELVRRVAGRLALGVTAPDVVAYLGAGRFGWLTEQSDLRDIERRLKQCAELPVEIDGSPVYLSLKIGVVRGTRRYTCAEDVVRDGVIASRRAGENLGAVNVFKTNMRLQPLEDLRLEMSLRQAVAEQALRLEYQPIVDLQTSVLLGFEALVRWSASDGPVSPARFIPLAERTGLIAPIGKWVLANAAKQLARWNAARDADAPVMVSVNVSARQITPLLVAELRELLEQTELAPERLKLEFTETAMADDPRTVEVLEQVRELGVQVWIDDFGTGFSSLAYLQRFPISGLKLDKSFVDPLDGTPPTASMAGAIKQISEVIGVDTVAEGIETEAQRVQLRELGYKWGQGYLFSRPMRVEEVNALLESGGPVTLTGAG